MRNFIPKKVVLLGSGGLSIGQAGEFDYSGTQAIKALLEENIEIIVINPNIATVQTDPHKNVKIYLYPVTANWVRKIFEIEKPDAILASFGGQTALNCLLSLEKNNDLKKYNVRNLGTHPQVVRLSEDRDLFSKEMESIGLPVILSDAADNVEKSIKIAKKIGYPVIVRAAYALGGLGSGFANNDSELSYLVSSALSTCPQVLIEKSLKGWKEIEYEVMRDSYGNSATICNIENFDPLGIHTGDSIAVAPCQSLNDDEYQILRDSSIKIISHLKVVGEANVQFALSPYSNKFYVIEANPRLSRSSALASKATGYPIAYIAAKLMLGYNLLDLKNPVTKKSSAFFEPALDYVTVKIPKWDLQKFSGVSKKLGSTMKSVGEVMGIGRNFPEAIQKAVRMVTENHQGIWAIKNDNISNLKKNLEQATDTRLFDVLDAFRNGLDIYEIYKLTFIDKWFLYQIKKIVDIEYEIKEFVNKKSDLNLIFNSLQKVDLYKWKKHGFGDEQIAAMIIYFNKLSSIDIKSLSLKIRKKRMDLNIKPVVKSIDTTSGEFPSDSNYFYLSYDGSFNDKISVKANNPSAIILGGGAYRIGSSVEFDWCAVSCSKKLQKSGWDSVMINCNPETVSTDYNVSDRLYFEEISLERILDIIDIESPRGVIVSMGGQLPNKLGVELEKNGIKILGHNANSIDQAESRDKFSKLLDKLKIDQPRWVSAVNKPEIEDFIKKIGYPVLVRPSYVLSGAAMKVAYNDKMLEDFLEKAAILSSKHPVVISEFITGAREIELDGVAQNGRILTSIVSEHIENAGIHSGDATMVMPAQNIYLETVRRIKKASKSIVENINLNGPFNIQFLAKYNHIKVIECNVRASRSFPFVSKVSGLNLAKLATQVFIDNKKLNISRLNDDELPHIGVKAAMFSFARLSGADPVIGVEMASTGEVGCIANDFDEAILLALESAKIDYPIKTVLISAGPEESKIKFLPAAKILNKLNIKIYATSGTCAFLNQREIPAILAPWPKDSKNDVLSIIKSGLIDLIINIPKSFERVELSHGSQIRKTASRFHCPLITNIEKAMALIRAIEKFPKLNQSHTPICI